MRQRIEAHRRYRLIATFIALTFIMVGGLSGNLHAWCIPTEEIVKEFDTLEPNIQYFDLDPGFYLFEETVWNKSDSLTWTDFHMEIEGGAKFLPWTASSTEFSVVDAEYTTLDFSEGVVGPSDSVDFGFKVWVLCEPFTLKEYPTVPEPATMLLLGSGLIGLVGFRRKFRKG